MIANMQPVVVMAEGRREFALIVMRMAMMFVGMALMVTRDRSGLHQAGSVGDRRAEPKHRQRKQADHHCSDGHDSILHHPQPYNRLVKAW